MKKARIKVTFAGFEDATAIALAQLGQSDKVIMRDCHLTQGQIAYRMRRAKDALRMKEGFRQSWRNGTSPICARIKDDILAVLRAETQRTLPGKIVHVLPKGSKEK